MILRTILKGVIKMQIKNKTIIILFLLILVSEIKAEIFPKPSSPSTLSIHLLENGIHRFNARATGLCGAYTALSNDISGSYWNPAALIQIKKKEVTGWLVRQHWEEISESLDEVNRTSMHPLGWRAKREIKKRRCPDCGAELTVKGGASNFCPDCNRIFYESLEEFGSGIPTYGQNMSKKKNAQRQAWMRAYAQELKRLGNTEKMDWDTAHFFFSKGEDPKTAAKKFSGKGS